MFYIEWHDGFYRVWKELIDGQYFKLVAKPKNGGNYKIIDSNYYVHKDNIKRCFYIEEGTYKNNIFYSSYMNRDGLHSLYKLSFFPMLINYLYILIMKKKKREKLLFSIDVPYNDLTYSYKKVTITTDRKLCKNLRFTPLPLAIKNSIKENPRYLSILTYFPLETELKPNVDLRDSIEFINNKKRSLTFIKLFFIVLTFYLYMKVAINLRGYSGELFRIYRFASNAFIFFMMTLYFKVRKRSIKVYNELLSVDIMKALNPEWDYNPVSDLTKSDIKYSRLVDHLHIVTANNQVTGIIDGIKFSLCHLEVIRYRIMFGPFSRLFFRGYFLEFELPCIIENRIDIRPKVKDYSKIVYLPRQEMDDSRFNKRFDVFSDDPIRARMALTADVYEKIIELENKYPQMIAISFVNKYVYVSINLKEGALSSLTVENYDLLIESHKNFTKYIKEFAHALSLIMMEEE